MKHLFILCLFMLTASFTFAQTNKLLQQKTITTSAGKELKVNTDAGAVEITTTSSNAVIVKIFGNNAAETRMTHSIAETSEGVLILGAMNDKEKGGNFSLRYEITVPESYKINIKTGGGGVDVNGITGKIDIITAGGELALSNITGDIDASTMGGQITMSNCKGDIIISTMGGSLDLSGSDGKIKATTGGGNISLDYSGANEGIELTTMAGSIDVTVPESFTGDANLSTSVGTIYAYFKNNGKSSSLREAINGGGKELKCSTGAGNISIEKK